MKGCWGERFVNHKKSLSFWMFQTKLFPNPLRGIKKLCQEWSEVLRSLGRRWTEVSAPVQSAGSHYSELQTSTLYWSSSRNPCGDVVIKTYNIMRAWIWLLRRKFIYHCFREGNENKYSSFPTRSSLRYFGFIANLRQAKAIHIYNIVLYLQDN